MSKTSLKVGTYVRERDGANHVYHSDLTCWNMPQVGLEWYLSGKANEVDEWRLVNDANELAELRDYLCDNLKPGENVEIDSYCLENWIDWEKGD